MTTRIACVGITSGLPMAPTLCGKPPKDRPRIAHRHISDAEVDAGRSGIYDLCHECRSILIEARTATVPEPSPHRS